MSKKYEINGETLYVENGNLIVDSVYYDSVDILMGKKPREIHDKTVFTREQIEQKLNQLYEDWKNARCFCRWEAVEYAEDETKRYNTYLNVLDDIMIAKEVKEVCFNDETFEANCAIISKEDCAKMINILSNPNKDNILKRILNGIPDIIICQDENDANLIFKYISRLEYHDSCNQTYCNVDISKNMISIAYGDY